jgi:hypothetical protein
VVRCTLSHSNSWNTIALTGALPHNVKNLSDIRQDGEMISRTLSGVGVELMGNRPGCDIGGWTIDNTRTNHKVIALLADKHPRWVNIGCFAHVLTFAMKDFCTGKKPKADLV